MSKKISLKQKKALRKLLPEVKKIYTVLQVVKISGDMPIGKRHLFSRYKARGLIKMQKDFGRVYLTKRGKRLLESIRM
jgi:hypothetical protein